MTNTQFEALDKKQQLLIMADKALFMDKRETSAYEISLYQLFSFHVELCFEKDTNSVISFKPVVYN